MPRVFSAWLGREKGMFSAKTLDYLFFFHRATSNFLVFLRLNDVHAAIMLFSKLNLRN